MARWQPDARQRLERAALDLFLERGGFNQTTVPDITARARLTTRTFYRHFADKREVLFADADRMPDLARQLVLAADPDLAPFEVMRRLLPDIIAAAFDGRRDHLIRRKTVIDSDEGLRERELRKLEAVVDAVATSFRARGVDELTAAVVAETAVVLVKVSLRHWLDTETDADLPLHELLTSSLTALSQARDAIT